MYSKFSPCIIDLEYNRSAGEKILFAELHDNMEEFSAWLNKAENIAAAPLQPGNREHLKTELERVKVKKIDYVYPFN